MNGEWYEDLRELAHCSYEDCYVGVKVLLTSDPHFKKFMERKYRLAHYYETGDLFLTANERYFHLIGFIDAIIYLERSSKFCWKNNLEPQDDVDEPEDEEERLYLEKLQKIDDRNNEAINSLIRYVECGENW